ncbi:hypothetical protein ED28_00135 [[Pantoea] beijingensis]|uniref:Uncharacterized protein n=1 Tax=[Pantoea] beijingensis TaxID=1324864 RepID=A0A443IHC5_9GAMM|nr:hypothetical protein ED28_00135 [[Pantoea] beijingensis]
MLGVVTLCFLSGVARSELWVPEGVIANENLADLSAFNVSEGQLPGTYAVAIYLNGEVIGNRDIAFMPAKNAVTTDEAPLPTGRKTPFVAPHAGAIRDNTGLVPCLTRQDMQDFGLRLEKFPVLAAVSQGACLVPGNEIPDAFTEFDFGQMRLNISIPQADLSARARGDISPDRWDNGINAALLNYSVSGGERTGRYGRSSDYILHLDSGLNIEAWRLRDGRTLSYQNSRRYHVSEWQHSNTYLERAIPPFRSNLTLGDSRTENDVFDSLGFRGARLATDEEMFPDSLHGFAPVIRGMANSSAEVTVRQGGYVVYQTPVPAGPFVIRDLWAIGTSGDLEVTVKEADGSRKVFTVPYSTLPVLVREGYKKYGLTVGQLRSSSEHYQTPLFVQGELKWGLTGGVTAYGGMQLSARYQAAAAGVGINLAQVGAVSADVTHADSMLADGSHHRGQSARFLYSWRLKATDTTFNLVGYRYSTQGFHTLDETALKGMRGWLYADDRQDGGSRPVSSSYNDYYNLYSARKGRLEATVTQKISRLGSLYLTGVRENYWSGRNASASWQAGISGYVGRISYNLGGRYQQSDQHPHADKSASLFLSVPLEGLFSGQRRATGGMLNASFSLNEDNSGSVSQQTGLNGTALEEQRLGWSLSQGHSRAGRESGNVSLTYRGGKGTANMGYSYSDHYHSMDVGFNGGAILHGGGLTLGQSFYDGAALVAAKGGKGTKVSNTSGVKLDKRGYALVPWVMPYRENSLSLDVTSMPDDLDSDGASQTVIPSRGAVVRTEFMTKQGVRVLMTLLHNGKYLPFGTVVTGGTASGITGDDGQVYLSGLPPAGELKAKWGRTSAEQCSVTYQLPTHAKVSVVQLTENCR